MDHKYPREEALDPPCETGARHLTQAQLTELIMEVRRDAQLTPRAERPALERALANLECEAAARGLTLPGPIEEPMPPSLAFELLQRALLDTAYELADRALAWVEPPALFLAVRRIREHRDQHFRTHCLRRVLYRMDTIMLGPVPAHERYERQSTCDMSAEDLEAYVELCIASLFSVALSQPYHGGAR